jgi:hypothetical protein
MRFILIILNWFMLLLPRLATAETLTIVSDHRYPMNGKSRSEMPGYMIELSKAIFKPHNIKVIYKTLPWERAVKQHAMAPRIYTLLDSSSVVHVKLKELNKGNTLREAGNIIEPVKMFIACSPKLSSSQRYVYIIDKETQRLIKSGELQKIQSKYSLNLWSAN